MKQKTKAELREEIERLRQIGSQMANLCWNLGRDQELTFRERLIAKRLAEEWDDA